jgi:hypothetical protein
MKRSGMVNATNPDRNLIAVTDDKGFTILDLDGGQAEIGDTLTSDVEGKLWFNTTRSIRLVAYLKEKGVRPNDLREHLFRNDDKTS